MGNYVRWSLHLLYLLFFWPTQFKREVDLSTEDILRQRFAHSVRYLGWMIPWVVVLAVLGNLTFHRIKW